MGGSLWAQIRMRPTASDGPTYETRNAGCKSRKSLVRPSMAHPAPPVRTLHPAPCTLHPTPARGVLDNDLFAMMPALAPYGPTLLRLTVGLVLAMHGFAKLLPMGEGTGLPSAAAFFGAAGFRPAYLFALTIGLLEAVGGLALVVGLFVRVMASVLFVEMAVAAWVVHRPHGFFLNWSNTPGVGHGYEYSLLLLGALGALVLTGGGFASLDGRRAHTSELEAARRARATIAGPT